MTALESLELKVTQDLERRKGVTIKELEERLELSQKERMLEREANQREREANQRALEAIQRELEAHQIERQQILQQLLKTHLDDQTIAKSLNLDVAIVERTRQDLDLS